MPGWCRICLFGLFLLLSGAGMAGDYVGDMIAIEGTVTLRDDKARKTTAQVGMPVETGQLIKTAKDSTAEIRLADGATFRIAAESTFILDGVSRSGTRYAPDDGAHDHRRIAIYLQAGPLPQG